MLRDITATFVDGVFKPDEQVSLPPQARVRLTVQPLDAPSDTPDDAWAELERLWDEVSVDSGGVHLTRDQLHERR